MMQHQRQCGSAGRLSYAASLPELLGPVDGVDEYSERILAQAICVARGLDHDGEDGGPAFGRGKLAVLVAALRPGDAEALRRGPDDARDLDRDLHLAKLGEGVVEARVVVERRCAT